MMGAILRRGHPRQTTKRLPSKAWILDYHLLGAGTNVLPHELKVAQCCL